MPLSLHRFSASMLMWLSWLSNRSTTGWLKLDLEWWMKCCRYKTNVSVVIQPLGYAEPAVPGGAPINMCCLKWTRGNTRNVGMLLPVALMVQHAVTSCPRSWEVTAPTCFVPFCAMTFVGLLLSILFHHSCKCLRAQTDDDHRLCPDS